MIPMFYDRLFGMVVSTAGCPPTRTAFLHADYSNVTPIEEPLTARGGSPTSTAGNSSLPLP